MSRSSSLTLVVALLICAAGCASVPRRAHEGDLAAVNEYLAKGGQVDARFTEGGCDDCTLLDAAADGGQVQVVAALLDGGADPNSVGGHGLTPLHYAVGGQSAEVARLLLSRGARPSLAARDQWGNTPLLVAVASVRRWDRWVVTAQGAVAKQERAAEPSAEVIEILLDSGAEVNAVTARGNTPLHIAAYKGYANTVRLLLAKGASRAARNPEGETPEALADRYHRAEVVAILRAR